VLTRRAEPGRDQQRAELVAVQGGGMGLICRQLPLKENLDFSARIRRSGALPVKMRQRPGRWVVTWRHFVLAAKGGELRFYSGRFLNCSRYAPPSPPATMLSLAGDQSMDFTGRLKGCEVTSDPSRRLRTARS